MRTIRILATHHALPSRKSVTTIFFQNLLPVLKNRINIEMIWLVYTPDKLPTSSNEANIITVDIHDYKNAVEVINAIKPDLIFAKSDYDYIHYAFCCAAKFLNIPVFSFIFKDIPIKRKRNLFISYIIRFFENSVPTDIDKNKKRFMKRGRFLIYKQIFMLRTLKVIYRKKLKVFQKFFMLLKMHLIESQQYDSQFANDLHLVESEKLVDPLIKAGFKKSSLVVIGNPTYDVAFQRVKSQQSNPNKSNKIRVLLATTSLYEHGLLSKQQRDVMVKDIITKICKHVEISLEIKIHPSSERLTEYQSLVESIGQHVPIYQEGDILDYLERNDVVIVFTSTSLDTYALISKKPIIIYNVYDIDCNLLLKRGLAVECKDASDLIELIHNVLSENPATEEKVNSYLREFLCNTDGKSSERASNAILKLVEKSKTTNDVKF